MFDEVLEIDSISDVAAVAPAAAASKSSILEVESIATNRKLTSDVNIYFKKAEHDSIDFCIVKLNECNTT